MADVILAHAFGERYELPIPLVLFVTGGAAVVLLSFLLVLLIPHGRAQLPDDAAPPPAPDRRVAGAVSVLVALLLAVVGLTGDQEVSENLAPVVFWLVWWVVVPFSCGVLGDWTVPVNPFAVVARAADSTRLRQAVLARRTPLAWPARLQWWPSLVLFVLLVLGELVFNQEATRPSFVGLAILVYLIASGFLGLLFGPAWLKQGEVFANLFRVWGRLGYWRFRDRGRTGFGGGLETPLTATPSRLLLALLLLISINFDGLLATPQWASYERRTFGAGSGSLDLLRIASLVVLIVLFLGAFGAFATWSARVGGFSRGVLPDLAVLLPSLVPIAFGYLVAHYAQYVLVNGQLLIPLIGNPGYASWPHLLPAPFDDSYTVNPGLLPNSAFWYLSLLVIVAVHVAAVVIAHRALSARATDRRRAVRSELPWLVAMVGYTALSLFLIAQPLTTSA